MATTFKITTIVQNLWAASRTKAAIRHRLPDLSFSVDGYSTAVMEIITGTSNPGFVNDGGQLYAIGGGSAVLDPITGGQPVVGSIKGFAVSVGRASVSVAPTGTPELDIVNWGGHTAANIPIPEGTVIVQHIPNAGASVDSENISVDLGGTTGYKVSLIVWFAPS
jgi:hypothetical protein